MSKVIESESNKLHPSNDIKPFPFILLCGICLDNSGHSRYFSNPKAKFYHIHWHHKNEPFKLEQELAELEQLSILNQRGIFIK